MIERVTGGNAGGTQPESVESVHSDGAAADTESLTDLIDRLDRASFLRSLNLRRSPVLTRHPARSG